MGNSSTIDGSELPEQTARALIKRFPCSKGFAVYLVGKDGGTKLTGVEPVNPLEIYQLIDSMPMRQREIRENQQN